MDMIDTLLDTTLVGYSRVGFAARRLDVMEKFPRLADRHVVVSGATGGIGSAVARRLVDNGAVVHAIGRTPAKLDRLVGSMDGHVVPHLADLSSMRDVRAVVESITATAPHVDAIANNVGVMEPQRRITAEGFERTYATNLLGQYVLTEGLRPAFTDGTRVVFVSSGGMYSQPLGDVESSQGDYTPTHAYARTKRGQVSLATELSTRIE
ncbi:MAG: SDR family NAD(P)-dependent oxidoreductase, partial [Acidimicrobiia bacterium]|nr:SDR family NAD(P)-dependent oxidoreductase [Acidimicrobiia bacterium]